MLASLARTLLSRIGPLFDLSVAINSTEYRASCPQVGYAFVGPAVCMATRIRGEDALLAIGESEASFNGDPDFHRLKQSGELRIFDPFDVARFEPATAALVVNFFVHQVQRQRMAKSVPLLGWITVFLLDRFSIDIEIEAFGSLAAGLRDRFLHEVRAIPSVRYLRCEIEGLRIRVGE